MKVAVVGSRGFTDYDKLSEVLSEIPITEIISGGAAGADSLAEKFAAVWEIPITILRPDWSKGRGAGLARNTDIVTAADLVIAFWDGKSPGTRDSIRKAKNMGKEVKVIRF